MMAVCVCLPALAAYTPGYYNNMDGKKKKI